MKVCRRSFCLLPQCLVKTTAKDCVSVTGANFKAANNSHWHRYMKVHPDGLYKICSPSHPPPLPPPSKIFAKVDLLPTDNDTKNPQSFKLFVTCLLILAKNGNA